MSDGVKVDKGKKGMEGCEICEMVWSIILYSYLCFFVPYIWLFPGTVEQDAEEPLTIIPLFFWLFTCCAGWGNKQVSAMGNLKGFTETITDLQRTLATPPVIHVIV